MKDVKMSAEAFMTLRRTITPYIGQSVILAGVTILLLWVALKKQQWGLVWAAVVICGTNASYVFLFGMAYRVYWDESGVMIKASGGPARKIPFEEITQVRRETASADEFLSQARPYRRIVIVGHPDDPDRKIDVSPAPFSVRGYRRPPDSDP